MKMNATDYLTKPFAVEELLGKIQESLRPTADRAQPGRGGGKPAGPLASARSSA